MKSRGLDRIFNPSSIAFVGASQSTEKAGGRRWKTIVDAGFTGKLFPVNPSASEIYGHRAYRNLRAIGSNVDLVFLAVSSEHVSQAIEDCRLVDAQGIVIITGGFGEIDQEGRRREKEIVEKAQGFGARVFGPNCAGIFSAPARYNALGWDVPPGSIGLVSQSGNIALDFADMARRSRIGFSRYTTIGNAADVNPADLIEYYLTDEATRVILAYVEGFGEGEGRAIIEMVSRAPVMKPVIILKPGRSETGRRAALSHTGSLAGEDRLVEATFRQAGIIRAYDVDEAWATAAAFATTAMPSRPGIAVLTDGGGHATLFCDTAGLVGLAVPQLSEKTTSALSALLPARCALQNPIDFAGVAEGQPEIVPRVLEICLADPSIGTAAIIGHFGGYHKLGGPTLAPREIVAADQIAAISRRSGMPVHVHSVHAKTPLPAIELLRNSGIPLHRSIELSAKAIAHVTTYACSAPREPQTAVAAHRPAEAVAIIAEAHRTETQWLQEPEARRLLEVWNIAVPPWEVATSLDQCARAAVRLSGPVAMKLISPSLIHKSDAKGVQLNIAPESVCARFHLLMRQAESLSLATPRILITPMIKGDVEVVVGAYRDTQFGPVVMVGIGGVLVEVLNDTAFRMAPVTTDDATAMIEELKGSALFSGVRGRAPIATRPIADLLCRLSEMIAATPEIAEVDINPVIVSESGTGIADARVMLTHEAARGTGLTQSSATSRVEREP